MAAGLRRSTSHHARTSSLPCQSHPIISAIRDDIVALVAWRSAETNNWTSPAWLCTGMAQLELLLASLNDLLHLNTRTLTCPAPLLDDYLRLADAHSTFRAALIDLNQHHSEAQVAVRRRDDTRLATCVRAQRRAGKELTKLSKSLTTKSCATSDAELARVMREATLAALSTSAAVVAGVAAAAESAAAEVSASAVSTRDSWMVGPLRRVRLSRADEEMLKGEERRKVVVERLEGLKECVGALESRSERVLRSLVNTRVALLNMLPPSV